MRFEVMLKDPDGFSEAIDEAVDASRPPGLSDEEWAAVREVRRDAISRHMSRWVEHGEYVTVRFDLDADNAIVCENWA